ncbi:hypothetical protein B0H19DRAFT_1373226 [Mycena capillaripes]|nr:hypothetical protein B0H19DRAFT_1373226 [Mycena capillaripes]
MKQGRGWSINMFGGVGGAGGRGGHHGGAGGLGEGSRISGHFHQPNIFVDHCPGEKGIELLHLASVVEAFGDSADSQPQPRCHPETRVKLIEDLYKWATDEDRVKQQTFWLYGPAGAGKTAVMRTLCQRLQEEGQLGAAFFFKRGHATRGNAVALFVTLAYQLALHNPTLKPFITRIVERDPSITKRSLSVQLQRLIIEPCKELRNSAPITLLVDGLDECDPKTAQQEVLTLIGDAAGQPQSSLRFLIASRPESRIQETFDTHSFLNKLQPVGIEQSFDDVRKYLCTEFGRIYNVHKVKMLHISTPWPCKKVIEALVQKSSGYFIYAATVISFVDDEFANPVERLEIIQNLIPVPIGDSPFAALDQLYTQILTALPTRLHAKVRDVLCVIFNFSLPLREIDTLLELRGDITLIIRGLPSLLNVSKYTVSPHHASFREFLEDQKRSSSFYIGTCVNVACSVLRAFSTPLSTRQCDQPLQHLPENIGGKRFIQYIVSHPPSAELLPFIQDLNPDRFPWINIQDFAETLITWLKKLSPTPHELIQLWEDYCSMESCNLRIIAAQTERWMLTEDSPPACVMFFKILQVAKIFNEFGIPASHDLLAMRMLLAFAVAVVHYILILPSTSREQSALRRKLAHLLRPFERFYSPAVPEALDFVLAPLTATP